MFTPIFLSDFKIPSYDLLFPHSHKLRKNTSVLVGTVIKTETEGKKKVYTPHELGCSYSKAKFPQNLAAFPSNLFVFLSVSLH